MVALGLATLAACKSFDVTDPNNPALESLRAAPTRSLVTNATTGILVAARTGAADCIVNSASWDARPICYRPTTRAS